MQIDKSMYEQVPSNSISINRFVKLETPVLVLVLLQVQVQMKVKVPSVKVGTHSHTFLIIYYLILK